MIENTDLTHKAEDVFIEGIHAIGQTWGMNSVEAKIIGYLYSQDKPTSLNDLTESLAISKGNISVSIRKLEEKNIVKNTWVKGDRRDYYEINMDIWQIFMKKFIENYKSEAQKALSTIDTVIPLIQDSFSKISTGGSSDKARTFMQKLQKLKTYYTLADEIGKTLEQSPAMFDASKLRIIWGSLKAQLKTIK
jgi:DNA-binding transcriptional regulator GbsR (MarR family)